MKHLLRPYRKLHQSSLALFAVGCCLAVASHPAHAQSQGIVQFFEDSNPLLVHASSQGYLGVDISDVDTEKAQALKLRETRGAVITLIDHDAPAGQIGLKVNDVVLALNGQNVDGAEQLRKMLKEIPAGRSVSIEISRDGNIQTIAVQLAERKTLEHDVWDKIGALVEPLTSQMAEYLGVSGGLMVKQVTRKSEAASAGFRAFDVILKVGPESITTSADWERALHTNEGKTVAVTILRDKKQQTLTLQVDSKRRGAVQQPASSSFTA
jgi:S1-C subfamily serine protease